MLVWRSKVVYMLAAVIVFAATGLGQSRDGAFSPDGSTIVYVSRVGEHTQVFKMNRDGSNKKQITKGGTSKYYPFFSPDAKKLVFMSVEDGKTRICTINVDGSQYGCVTGLEHEFADPDWSTDGKRIIHYSDIDGNNEIYTMDPDGGNRKRLTNHPASDQTPSYSPDGKHIVFVSDRDGNAEIYVMRSDGSNVRRLTFDPRTDRVPRWSPDGKKIIWYSREPSDVVGSGASSWKGAEIYEINVDGTGRKQITQNLTRDHGPVYSPDGKSILFTSARTGRREVFIMDSDGSNPRQLTR